MTKPCIAYRAQPVAGKRYASVSGGEYVGRNARSFDFEESSLCEVSSSLRMTVYFDAGLFRRRAIHVDYKAVVIGGSGFGIPTSLGGELERICVGKMVSDLCAVGPAYIVGAR